MNPVKKICAAFSLLILLLTAQLSSSADHSDPYFVQHYDNRNGLSNSSINNIYRDADNILWIATWDGLNMYDGTSFHVFNYSKQDDNKSIGSNVIQSITEDKSGNIWIATIGGISRFEKHSGKFYNYFYDHDQRSRISEQEFSLAVDTAGNVYCLNQKTGLSYYNEKTDRFVACNLPGQVSRIHKIGFDSYSHLWLLNSNGELEVWTGNQQHFKYWRTYRDISGIVNFFPVNQQVFFTTASNQLSTIDNTAIQRKLVQMKSGVSSIIYYKDHYLVAGSVKGYDVYDHNFQQSSFLATEKLLMHDIKVTSWTLGSEDILWYGTDGNGIIKIYPKTKSFSTITTSDNVMRYNRSVRSFCEENGNLWVGTKGSGIIRIKNFLQSPGDPALNKEFYLAPKQLDNNAVYSLKNGKDGLIYIGSDGKGIGIYDLNNEKFYKWSQVKGHNAYPEFGSVYAILQDEDNSVWLGTSGYGLIHLKIDRDPAGNLSLAFLERFTFKDNNTGPANDIIYALSHGSPGQLWIGCRYGGLSLLNKNTKKFKTFKALTYKGSLSNNDVLSIYKDSRNRIWVGTSYGLNWIENADALDHQPVFKKLTTENGLQNNTIHAIEEDRTGHIWVSTNRGLAKVNQANLKVWYYQQSDGLQSNEFCDGAVWKDHADNLYFGGTYGFNYFLPQNIRKTSWQPNLILSGITIGEKSPNENGFVVLRPGTHKPFDFVINRNDNYFKLDARAISFLNTEKCEYAYYLEGYDKTWHPAGSTGKIDYSNITPGNYTLHFKWSNGDGIWTSEMALFNLQVKQYFWLTNYAFLGYALLLSILSYLVFSWRKNKMEIKHQLAVEHLLRTKEDEIHQNRLGFFTNIAHELQTPLTLIMGSTERYLDKTNAGQEHKEKPYFLSLIHQQASRLTYLVHQLLEFRKGEEGFFKNKFDHVNISELLSNLAEPFMVLSEQKAKRFEMNIWPEITGWVDKDKLEKIIFNLLSNAFKHSGKNEEIILSAHENELTNELELTIANSGIQLSTEQLKQLFEQFYVVNQKTFGKENFGTGIGLAFTRQLVTLLDGRIEANSKNGWITFKVFLPIKNSVVAENDQPETNGMPSYLYQTITSNTELIHPVSAKENNKQAIIEDLHDDKRKKILLVEDEPGIRYLLKDILKDTYIIYEAEDGQKAIELIWKIAPDLVICDVLMPNMNGLELCNKIKNTPATCQIPFIILSARSSEDNHMEGYEVGADAYIAKPFHTEFLKLRVRKLLDYRQKLHELFKVERATEMISDTDLPDDDKSFLVKLIKIIEENLDEPALSAGFIEKTFSQSKMQLYRKLKTMTGMTPGEFIKNIRLKNAANLLISTHHTVSEIYYKTGFNNQSYFFREFKKRYGCSPNEYREQQTVGNP